MEDGNGEPYREFFEKAYFKLREIFNFEKVGTLIKDTRYGEDLVHGDFVIRVLLISDGVLIASKMKQVAEILKDFTDAYYTSHTVTNQTSFYRISDEQIEGPFIDCEPCVQTIETLLKIYHEN